MRKKIEVPEEVLRYPECVECFENINTHANYVFGMFEVNSAELMEKQKVEFTEHLKIQDAKYDVFLDRADKRDNRRANANLLILTLFASVIAYSYIHQSEIENRVNVIDIEKVDKTEVVNKYDFEVITQGGDEYNRNMFVQKSEITADTFSYPMNKKRLFNNTTRGSLKTIPLSIR